MLCCYTSFRDTFSLTPCRSYNTKRMVRIIRVRRSRQHDQLIPVPDHRRNFGIDCKSAPMINVLKND